MAILDDVVTGLFPDDPAEPAKSPAPGGAAE